MQSPLVPTGPVLRPGRVDALVVLWLWVLRRSVIPLLFLGLALAVAVSGYDQATLAELSGPADYVRATLSPLAGVVIAFGLRVAVGFAALVAAWPVSGWVEEWPRNGRSLWLRSWVDRLSAARAYRALRWTWAVRVAAQERVGRTGAWIGGLATAMTVLIPVSFVVLVAVLAANPPLSATG